MKNNKSLKYSFLLLLTAMIWGSAFVAQSAGMDYVGPFTFLCIRNFIGFIVLIPVMLIFGNKAPAGDSGENNKNLILGAIVCGFFLFTASAAQQIGIQYTSAGKAGFLTAFYIVLVPVFGLFLKKHPGDSGICSPLWETFCSRKIPHVRHSFSSVVSH